MVCLRYLIVNTVRKGNNKSYDDYDDDNDDNNNNALFRVPPPFWLTCDIHGSKYTYFFG